MPWPEDTTCSEGRSPGGWNETAVKEGGEPRRRVVRANEHEAIIEFRLVKYRQNRKGMSTTSQPRVEREVDQDSHLDGVRTR